MNQSVVQPVSLFFLNSNVFFADYPTLNARNLFAFQDFYTTILNHIMDEVSDPSKAHFDAYRDAVRRIYHNEALKPTVLNSWVFL